MKKTLRTILMTGVAVLSAQMMLAGPQTNAYLEGVHTAKMGRCPAKEARLAAERANAPFIEEQAQTAELNSWTDRWHKAKHNMTSAADGNRLSAERERKLGEEVGPAAAPDGNAQREQWYKAKFGRGFPTDEK